MASDETIRDDNTYVLPQKVLDGVGKTNPIDVVVVYRNQLGNLQIASCTGNINAITKVLNAASKWLDESQYHPTRVQPLEFGKDESRVK